MSSPGIRRFTRTLGTGMDITEVAEVVSWYEPITEQKFRYGYEPRTEHRSLVYGIFFLQYPQNFRVRYNM